MGEIGLSENEINVNKTSKPVEQVVQAGSQSRIRHLKDLLRKVKERGVRNKAKGELQASKTESVDLNPEVKAEVPEGTPEQKPVAEIFQREQNSAEISTVEPVKKETIEEICNVMAMIPRLGEAYGYDIPYRTERRMHTDGVFDSETGLYIEASYIPKESPSSPISQIRTSPGLTIVLSTPPLMDEATTATSLNKMGEALSKIYGDSAELDDKIKWIKGIVGVDRVYDKVKFELFYNEGEEVLNGFSAVSGKERVPIEWWGPPKKQILETGGHFLKEIVERVKQKQIEEAEKNKLQTQQTIDKVKNEAIPNDESKVYQYAYHATDRRNIPSISQNGLQPSGENSKEPGTVWFTGWDSATVYHPDDGGGEGVLYRFRVLDMPEIAKLWYFDDKSGLRGPSISTATSQHIPPDRLDFSLDRGETWMPNVPRNIKQTV